ncbi:MAG: type IIA DNA topoisomerase subunit B [Chloroflexi bacterium]|nr:type IIA DNA topoisomerase subunit B [Chloroflexota bacterium]MCC6893519.1 type IIA DNA topoisomerase subunit B [Anaerolineae bacterium]
MADQDTAQIRQQSDEDVRALEPIDHVRLRPGMYVGGVDKKALHHLVYEVVDNSVDEALAGRCDRITVTLADDNVVSVQDNGGGIPVGMNKDKGKSTVEVVMTVIGAGGKFGSGAYKVSGGLHGVGVSAVNALSEQMRTNVFRDGYLWEQSFRRGRPTEELKKIRKLTPDEHTGTLQTFRPDFTIMDQNDFDFEWLAQRFREMTFVTRRVAITLRDERVRPIPRELTFYFEGGLYSYVRYLNRNRRPLHDPVHIERDVEFTPEGKPAYSIGVEVAFQYNDSANVVEMAFANTINTPDGGTHLTGLRSAITGVINRYARKAGILKEKDPNFSGADTLEGITTIVSIKHPGPSFESQTKVKLINPEVQGAVSQVVTEAFNEYLEDNPREARRIVDKCMTSMRAREAARKARDLVRSGPSLLESTTLPGKLADCSQKGEGAEIYIVEGDSAGGSAKQGRDRHFQAILPLRGKILNTERARMDKVLDSNEIKALISTLGTGIAEDFSVENLRYGRVIIMTDADVDGSHIRTLLLTFFFRHMQAIIAEGHLYIAQPPIYLLKSGKKMEYVYPEAGMSEPDILARALKKYDQPDKVGVQRYKGLGEMNPDQLWETTMDPATRTLLQVTIEDAAEADRVFDMLMGSSVPPRRRFIQTHAKSVRNLDV